MLEPPTVVQLDPGLTAQTKRWIYEAFTWIRRGGGEASTTVATTSGTSHDFNVPVWATKITVRFAGVSFDTGDSYLIQLGDSGGIETSGYSGASSTMASVTATTNYSNGIGIRIIAAGAAIHGRVVIENHDGNTWVASGVLARSDTINTATTGSSKTLSSVLTQLRVTSNSGTSNFDAGSITVKYE